MAQDDTKMISRRNMLMKLGLAAGAAYVAPTLVGLDVARASSGSSGGGNSGGGNSGGSSSSGPSRPSSSGRSSGPSRPSGNGRSSRSTPSRPQRASTTRTQWRWDSNRMRFVRVKVRR